MSCVIIGLVGAIIILSVTGIIVYLVERGIKVRDLQSDIHRIMWRKISNSNYIIEECILEQYIPKSIIIFFSFFKSFDTWEQEFVDNTNKEIENTRTRRKSNIQLKEYFK